MFNLKQADFMYFVYRNSADTYALERSRITCVDLTYLIFGEMTYLYNDTEFHLQAGDAILFPQGSIRERKATSIPVRYASINVHLRENPLLSIAGYLPGQTTAEALSILKIMDTAWHSGSGYTDSQCLALFAYLYCHLADMNPEYANPHIQSMKAYISKHLSEKLTLHEIAASVHLTPEYCCTLFKKQTGTTIFDYILHQRIDAARRLITLGDLPLQRVAIEVGLPDYNYFSRAFKRLAGVTPSAYKVTAKQ